jgi:eukaryotic-like serine/threonine-protein kinase
LKNELVISVVGRGGSAPAIEDTSILVISSPLDIWMNTPQPSFLIRFAAFELDLRARELRNDGRSTRLPDQSITVLAMLLERSGGLVLREDIRTKLWPNDTVVEFDHSINTAIGRLRLALGDSAENPRYVETLPRRGYRWIGPPAFAETGEPTNQSPAPAFESSPQRVPDTTLIGKRVSHYRVLEVLGGGGMGVVYKAEDLKLGRGVALKFLPEELAGDSAALQRFQSEARSASALNHSNICTIYGVEEHEGQPFLVMELLEGQTLRELIAATPPQMRPFAVTKLVDLAVQIAAGLEAAHQRGIIHRDIKPANVFVTAKGQAKILDFGLAKSSFTGAAEAGSVAADNREDGSSHGPKRETESLATSSPFLSRAGVAMGTAGYMSPEQVRGEKLDARTDLFSFGLVLYEIATGKRAFAGDTGPELQKAILTNMPCPARTVNPQVPAQLAKIVHRAVEKNREARYQSASELRADLENLKREIDPSHRRRWLAMAAAAGVVLLFAIAALWYAIRQSQSAVALPEIKLRQLTTNSTENAVTSGAISPDGKYLAYTDGRGMNLKLIETGETRTIPQPDDIKSDTVEWEIGPGPRWFPNGAKFLAISRPRGIDSDAVTSQDSSIWVVSVLGGPPRKLRDEARLDSISPDGSLIAFETNKGRLGDREIWVMRPDGEQARKVFEIDANGSIGGLQWSPDGQRVIYAKTVFKGGSSGASWDPANASFHARMDELSQTIVAGDLKGGPLTTIVLPFDLRSVSELLWMPDGRMVYRLWESGFNSSTCNLWQIRLDARTSQFIGKPQHITNLPAVCISWFSATSDGKRLVFLESRNQASVYVADLQAGGKRITNPTRFTLDEGWNNPSAWTADGKTFLFYSNRSGTEAIFKQSLGQDAAESLVTVKPPEGVGGGACLSPEGSWIFYGPEAGGPSAPAKLMRVPVAGGTSQVVLTSDFYGGPRCAKSPAKLCAISERSADRKQLAFTAFDAVKGRGSKLSEWTTEATAEYDWALSPDGTRIAILKNQEPRVRILSLNGAAPQEITVKGWNALTDVAWASDGKGLFVSSFNERGSALIAMDFQGNARLLWENKGGAGTYAVPSPDGRHLAMQGFTMEGNLWMMENF